MIQALQNVGAIAAAYDHQGTEQAHRVLNGADYRDGAYVGGEGVEVALIVTQWRAFRALDLRVAELQGSGEGRNVDDRTAVEAAVLAYHSAGRSLESHMPNARQLGTLASESLSERPIATSPSAVTCPSSCMKNQHLPRHGKVAIAPLHSRSVSVNSARPQKSGSLR